MELAREDDEYDDIAPDCWRKLGSMKSGWIPDDREAAREADERCRPRGRSSPLVYGDSYSGEGAELAVT